MHDPDPATAERIRHLAIVGTALNDTFSEENQDLGSDFFLAKDALDKFMQGIEQLNLDPVSMKGMRDLVAYLHKKIDKRMNKTDEYAEE